MLIAVARRSVIFIEGFSLLAGADLKKGKASNRLAMDLVIPETGGVTAVGTNASDPLSTAQDHKVNS
jgi:hypothetical protein